MTDAEERVARACEERAARAAALGSSEVLHFAAGLFLAQAVAVRKLGGVDFASAVAASRGVVDYVASHGPVLLAADATKFSADRLNAYWGGLAEFDYLARAALSPYAQVLRLRGIAPGRPEGPCAVCGGAPWMASRKGAAELQGANRTLICALCANEWMVPRIKCPACDEENPSKLPNYGAPEHPAVRIEACETCRGYVKSIDLSLDARPVPEVDDLVSLSMDLWAAEQGFERIEPGLAGL